MFRTIAFTKAAATKTDPPFQRWAGGGDPPSHGPAMRKLVSITLSAALLAACDPYNPRDGVEDHPVETKAVGDGDGDVQAPADSFPVDHVVIEAGSGADLVHMTVHDAAGAIIGSLSLAIDEGAEVATGSVAFGDPASALSAGRTVTMHMDSESVQLESFGLDDAEIDRRLRLIEQAITTGPQESGWSCGAYFAGWLVTCAATVVGCAVTGWPMACECAQWIEKKTGSGKVFEGGVCEDL